MQKAANFDELDNVTARVSHRPRLLERDPQGLRRPRFSFFRFNCQTAWPRSGRINMTATGGRINKDRQKRSDTETKDPNKGQNAESRSHPGQAQQKQSSARCEQTRGFSERNESPEKQNPRPPQKAAPLPMSTLYGPPPPHVNTGNFVKTSMNRLSAPAQAQGAAISALRPSVRPAYPHYPQPDSSA